MGILKTWFKIAKRIQMNKPRIYIFFDGTLAEYRKHFDSEDRIIGDLKDALEGFSKTTYIMLLTRQDTQIVVRWLDAHGLLQFIDNVSNPVVK